MLGRLRSFANRSQALERTSGRRDRFLYGLAHPFLGLKEVLGDRALFDQAAVPAGFLAAFCAAMAWLDLDPGEGLGAFLRSFYRTFALLAPFPSIVFARHYARFAAAAHNRFGFGDCAPISGPLHRTISRVIKKAIVVAVGLAVIALLGDLPKPGPILASVAATAWALHWVVVEALDDASVLPPGMTPEAAEAATERHPSPWFVRGLRAAAAQLPGPLGRLVGLVARITDRFSLPWREEMAFVEREPVIAGGFAVATAALLATPVLNLFFRPIIIVAASHLRGRLQAGAEPTGAPAESAVVKAS